MVWHFIGVYIINRTLHDRLEIRNFSSRVEIYFTRSLRSLVKYFSTLEEKFRISARPCNVLYLKTGHCIMQYMVVLRATNTLHWLVDTNYLCSDFYINHFADFKFFHDNKLHNQKESKKKPLTTTQASLLALTIIVYKLQSLSLINSLPRRKQAFWH